MEILNSSNCSISIIDGRFIKIIPNDGMKDNSTYEVKLRNVSEDGGERTLNAVTRTLTTAMTPFFTSIEAVESLIESCEVPPVTIMYHIREASKFLNYIKGVSYSGEIPFQAAQYVKYKAAHDCLLRYHIGRATEGGQKGAIGDVIFETKSSLPDITALLKELKKETAYWLDAVRGYKEDGRAKPLSAVKASNPGTRTNTDSPPTRSEWGG